MKLNEAENVNKSYKNMNTSKYDNLNYSERKQQEQSSLPIRNHATVYKKNYKKQNFKDKYNDVFGLNPYSENANTIKNKRKETRKEFKTPDRTFETAKIKDLNKTPTKTTKLSEFFFKDKKKDNQKTMKKEYSIQNLNKNMLKRATKIIDYQYSENFCDNVTLIYGDKNKYEIGVQKNKFEIRFLLSRDFHSALLDSIQFNTKYFEFPEFFIDKVKYNNDSKTTIIKLKDYRSFKIQTKDEEFSKKIKTEQKNQFDFYSYAKYYKSINKIKYKIDGWTIYDPLKEFMRQNIIFEMDHFRISQKNVYYELCETYPSLLVIPSQIDDMSLPKIASFRMKNRFPVLTYAYNNPKYNFQQTYLFRSAQVNTGSVIMKAKNLEVDYVNTLTNIKGSNKGFIFFDCRPYLSAKANSLKGAGIDDKNDYNNCNDLIYGCIENIHAVRNSLKKAVEVVHFGNSSSKDGKINIEENNLNVKKFLSKFEESKWQEYLSDIICGSMTVVNNILSQVNVICHCSDGWDRTSQVCSLTQIILDSYYRTIEGFAVLIEKDWISFGHQFAMRNGCDIRPEKRSERSPIFIQFLHVIYQLMIQYPTAFEFKENLLIFLSDEIYSNKYGTFLFNCEKELNHNKAKAETISIWSDILYNKLKFINPYYEEVKEPLIIKGEVQYLNIWKEYFFKYDKIGMVRKDNDVYDMMTHYENAQQNQQNNIIKLLQVIKKHGLEKEVKDNDLYLLYKNDLDKRKEDDK